VTAVAVSFAAIPGAAVQVILRAAFRGQDTTGYRLSYYGVPAREGADTLR
jgi:hypothetical protein